MCKSPKEKVQNVDTTGIEIEVIPFGTISKYKTDYKSLYNMPISADKAKMRKNKK
jgi:hypothetical protein